MKTNTKSTFYFHILLMSGKLPGSRNSHYFWHGPALRDPVEVDGDGNRDTPADSLVSQPVGRRTAQNVPRSKHFTRVSVRAAACRRGVDVQPISRRRPASVVVDVNGTAANASAPEVVCFP